MSLLRTLFIIWFFWWIIKKFLTYFGNNTDQPITHRKKNDRKDEFKQRTMDVQDAEFEEIDESR